MEDMTELERNDTKLATLYEVRLAVTANEKDNFTKEELLELLDTIAMTKSQK